MRKNMALMGALMGAALLGSSMPSIPAFNSQSFSNYKFNPDDSKGHMRKRKTNKLRLSHNAKLRRRAA